MRPTRRSLLAGAAGGLLAGWGARASAQTDRRLIVVFIQGGWDVTFALDPKPGVSGVEGPAALGFRGEDVLTVGSHLVSVNPNSRPSVGAFFEEWGHTTAICNGIEVGSVAHEACRARILTGTRDPSRPDIVSIVGASATDHMPLGFVDFSGFGHVGHLAAHRGAVGYYGQVRPLLDRTQAFPAPEGSGLVYPQHVPLPAEEDLVRSHLRARAEAFRTARTTSLDRSARLLDDHGIALDRAERLRRDASLITDRVALGAYTTFDGSIALTLDLLEAGWCRSMLLGTSLLWDTHDDNVPQSVSHETLFGGLRTLAAGLQERGLLEHTTVAVISEMGRTPALNADGGKEHWPHTSAMMFGAGIAGGHTCGATDDRVESQPVDLQTGEVWAGGVRPTYANLAAGLVEVAGIDPGRWYPGVVPYRGFHA